MAGIQGFHHLSLSVTELESSTRWYQEVLGLNLEANGRGPSFRRSRLSAAEGRLKLTLTSHDEQSNEPFSELRTGMDHVAFRVESAEAVKNRLDLLGVNHSGIKASGGGMTMITFRDPDNIQLEVFEAPTP